MRFFRLNCNDSFEIAPIGCIDLGAFTFPLGILFNTSTIKKRLKLNFHLYTEGFEALQAVTYFIDDAIMVGIDVVRILHGTGTGAFRHTIRQYLGTVYSVKTYRDEHVQFGGAGITIVEFE